MSDEPVFRVGNKHAADCGEPPHIDGSKPAHYAGYFENEYGEQAIFIYDRQSGTATLWMGDYGWENPLPVIEGRVEELELGEAEALWLRACWQAAIAGGSRLKGNTTLRNPEITRNTCESMKSSKSRFQLSLSTP